MLASIKKLTQSWSALLHRGSIKHAISPLYSAVMGPELVVYSSATLFSEGHTEMKPSAGKLWGQSKAGREFWEIITGNQRCLLGR